VPGCRARHSGQLATEAVKIWADGGMSSRTAAIGGIYPVPPYGSGILYFERDELTEMVRDFDARGFQVCIHAQGDRAIQIVLDAYDAVLAPGAGNPRPAPHRAWRRDVTRRWPSGPRAGDRGGEPARVPVCPWATGSPRLPGSRRPAYSFAFWQRAGITVAGFLRRTVITADPRIGIRDAILRRTGDGRVLARPSLSRPPTRSPCTPPGRLRLPPGERDRLARARQAGRLRRLGPEPLETEPERIRISASWLPSSAEPPSPIGKHLPRPLTGFQIPGKGRRIGLIAALRG